MKISKQELWQRFQQYYTEFPDLDLALDMSRMNFPDGFFETMAPRMQKAFSDMAALERGEIANPDEKRMVGHYWLRSPELAPTTEIRDAIVNTVNAIKAFAADVHEGKIQGQQGRFRNLLIIGIGGSALGPQFVAHALSHPKSDKMKVFFFDNTDPDGMDRVLAELEGKLGATLAIVISKSGGTKETRNGMLEAAQAYKAAGLDFARHSVAVTGSGSELDKLARENGWISIFPMWDWVGGRTSELSAVGLLPASLQGFDIKGIIDGSNACDKVTRINNVTENPSAMLALAWYYSGNGKGSKNMIILPYKDRLELISKYLQQLIMESIGKEKDLNGQVVNQGLSVFGNKGATDQHSYVQQLRDGTNNFFVTFIQVLTDRQRKSQFIQDRVTTGDYLNGFFLGTRQALFENGRESITITVKEVSPFTIGVLIAIFERAVGFYASLIGINAYHQPGVEAGKKAAEEVINLQNKVESLLESKKGTFLSAQEIAVALNVMDEVESVFKICQHLASSCNRGIQMRPRPSVYEARFGCF
jgi:glucose-6-phosphate isomerase